MPSSSMFLSLQAKLPNLKDVDVRYTEAWWSTQFTHPPHMTHTHINICTHCTQAQIHNMKIVWWCHLHRYHQHTRNSDVIPSAKIIWCDQNASDTLRGGALISFRHHHRPQWHHHQEGRNCLVGVSTTFFSKWETFMDLDAPLLSPMFREPFFLPTWAEDMQGPAMWWNKGPFSFSVFILCPVVHIWCLSLYIQLKSTSPAVALPPCASVSRGTPESTPRPSDPSLLFLSAAVVRSRLETAAHIPVHLRSDPQCSSPNRHVELFISSVLTLVNFGSGGQIQSSVFKYFIGKMRCYLRKKKLQDCAYFLFTCSHTHTHTKKQRKKKVFINLNELIFSNICTFIYCVVLFKTYIWRKKPRDDISEPFLELCRKVKWRWRHLFFFCFNLFSVYILMISHFY